MNRDLEFLYELGTLRFVDRTWRQFLSPEFANVSEHMFRVAWISMMIASREGNNNHAKILKMAMVHDVSESRTGDANGLQKRYVTRDESKAIHDIFNSTSLEQEMIDLWHEVEKRKTHEAQIVKDADYLDQLMELKEQASKGNTLPVVWKDLWQKDYGDKLFTRTAKEMLEQIYNSQPLDWHVNARKIKSDN